MKFVNYHTLFSQLTRLKQASLAHNSLLDFINSCSEACHGNASGTFTALGKTEFVHFLLQVFGNYISACKRHASSIRVLLHLTYEVVELFWAKHAVLVSVSSIESSRHLGHPFRLDWILSGSSTISNGLCSFLLGESSNPGASPLNNSLQVFGHSANLFLLF